VLNIGSKRESFTLRNFNFSDFEFFLSPFLPHLPPSSLSFTKTRPLRFEQLVYSLGEFLMLFTALSNSSKSVSFNSSTSASFPSLPPLHSYQECNGSLSNYHYPCPTTRGSFFPLLHLSQLSRLFISSLRPPSRIIPERDGLLRRARFGKVQSCLR